MNLSQRTVAVGAASGVAGMVALVTIFYFLIPGVNGIDTLADRIAYTLEWNVVAIIPFFIMLITVANKRFLSRAIDPTKHLESDEMEIDGRVADNTLQQNFVFFVGTLALSTFLDWKSIRVIPVLACVFILARIIFWIGYRINPLYRAPGMSSTAYMNLGILLTSLYFLMFTI